MRSARDIGEDEPDYVGLAIVFLLFVILLQVTAYFVAYHNLDLTVAPIDIELLEITRPSPAHFVHRGENSPANQL
jgi:hypothetical protein